MLPVEIEPVADVRSTKLPDWIAPVLRLPGAKTVTPPVLPMPAMVMLPPPWMFKVCAALNWPGRFMSPAARMSVAPAALTGPGAVCAPARTVGTMSSLVKKRSAPPTFI